MNHKKAFQSVLFKLDLKSSIHELISDCEQKRYEINNVFCFGTDKDPYSLIEFKTNKNLEHLHLNQSNYSNTYIYSSINRYLNYAAGPNPKTKLIYKANLIAQRLLTILIHLMI